VAGRSPTFECEFRVRHHDGHWLWLLARGRAVERDDQGRAVRVAGVRIDISRLKQAELALEQLAYIDSLTGALTRRRFLDLAQVEWARAQRHGQPVALLMIDLDHFKTVNDRWGHAGGDTVLRAFAATAGEVLRGSDLLGRVGGEEFAVLLPQTDRDGAMVLARRLQQLVHANPVLLAQGMAAYTVSIGVAAAEPGAPGGRVEALMQAADTALYRAKGQGRNLVLLADGPG
jgi:diguanylate cyclase (GGDEF)-like protein